MTGRPRALELFDRLVLRRPALALLALAGGLAVCGSGVRHFRVDASGDDLVLENDPDVRYYRDLIERYGGGDFVIATYSPPEDLFSAASLGRLRAIRDGLKSLPRVASVVTLLDVPLLKNKPGPLKDLKYNIRTLEDRDVDVRQAVAEFRSSPIYQHLLVSEDLRSAAIQVNFSPDEEGEGLGRRRSALRDRARAGSLAAEERAELERVERRYKARQDEVRAQRHEDLAAIRGVISRRRGGARCILGGVPMIVDDIIAFIRKDLKVFGVGMSLLMVGTLYLIFRRWRWVLLPMLTCLASVFAMMGLLGLLRLDVTVVSSNFTSLQLILTLALAVHLVGHYNELLEARPEAPNRELVRDAVGAVFVPALYAQLTTVVGFASLITSGILPIVNFGWMMSAGLLVSAVIIFLLLPAGMVLLPKPEPAPAEAQFGHGLTMLCAGFAERRRGVVFSVTGALVAATAVGLTRLEVENSFINYFKADTEIHRGMKFIDQNLGGTTPLDVVIDFSAPASSEAAPPRDGRAVADSEFDDFGEFEGGSKEEREKYWFTTSRLELVERTHDYLDALPETGKVLSLATVWKQARDLNDGRPLDDFAAAILFNALSKDFRHILIDPYVSVERNQVRVTTRIKDSLAGLRRDELIRRIRRDLADKVGLRDGEFRISGLMYLYNDMLQSLYRSQIKTIVWTLVPLAAMFWLLWRSVKIALVALVPSVIATSAVLGFMGLAGIPLDMMTITVVAVALGIVVDNATHYIHRFREEVAEDGDYVRAMRRCHATIGHNMIYSALPVILGFSILVLSNFVPSILFGLLVAVAVAIALVSDLNLLPSIILAFRPFGRK